MPLHIQGHRGARALAAENTLASFEAALDAGVDSIETDIHRSANGIPVLCHDPWIDAAKQILIARHGWHSLQARGVVSLAELITFVDAYAESAAKSAVQREAARRVILDLEIKRVPFVPELIGDDRSVAGPERLEEQVIAAIRRAGWLRRCAIRSFDHRCLREIRALEPELTIGALIAWAAPVAPESLCREVGASWYCPEFHFVDREMIDRCHAAGIRVMPWTVNEPERV